MFEVVWSKQAQEDLRRVPVFRRPVILAAASALRVLVETQTKNRKRLEHPLEELPEATWEVRVEGWRIFYWIDEAKIVSVLRVILKGTATTEHAVRRSKIP